MKTEIPRQKIRKLSDLPDRIKIFLSVEIGGSGKSKTKIPNTEIPSIKIPKISDLCSSAGFWRAQKNRFYFFARPLKSCGGSELKNRFLRFSPKNYGLGEVRLKMKILFESAEIVAIRKELQFAVLLICTTNNPSIPTSLLPSFTSCSISACSFQFVLLTLLFLLQLLKSGRELELSIKFPTYHPLGARF